MEAIRSAASCGPIVVGCVALKGTPRADEGVNGGRRKMGSGTKTGMFVVDEFLCGRKKVRAS